MKTVVMTAYDVNPFRGSEAGTGWNFPYSLSSYVHVTLITRPNNREHIEAYIAANPSGNYQNITFRYFDLPYWARFWKRRARGARLYFWVWQFFVVYFIRKNRLEADIYHGLNFHSDTTPSFLWMLNGMSVWGPINHNEPIPTAFHSGLLARVMERLKWTARKILWRCDPFLYLAKKKTNLLLVCNRSVVKRLRLEEDNNYSLVSTIASRDIWTERSVPNSFRPFQFLAVGRFVPIKSMGFALECFEHFFCALPAKQQDKVVFSVIGTGPLEQALRTQVADYRSKKHIVFRPWMPQIELFDAYREANCFVNFSHEGGGAVNAEAMSCALPVICFDNYGAGESVPNDCGIKIPLGPYPEIRAKAVQALTRIFTEEVTTTVMSRRARQHFLDNLSWRARAKTINACYDRLFEVRNRTV